MNRRLSGAADQLELLSSAEVQLEALARRIKENEVGQSEENTVKWKVSLRKLAEDIAMAQRHAMLSKQVMEQYFSQQDVESFEDSNLNMSEIRGRIKEILAMEDVQSAAIVQKVSEVFDGSSRLDDEIEAMETEPNENDFICPITYTRMENPMKKYASFMAATLLSLIRIRLVRTATIAVRKRDSIVYVETAHSSVSLLDVMPSGRRLPSPLITHSNARWIDFSASRRPE